jgi:hypothetical protein
MCLRFGFRHRPTERFLAPVPFSTMQSFAHVSRKVLQISCLSLLKRFIKMFTIPLGRSSQQSYSSAPVLHFKSQQCEEGMKLRCFGPKVLLAFLLILPSSLAFAAGAAVDCSGATPGAFTSITAALASLPLAGPNSITVTGTCIENVLIFNRTDLVVSGNPTATIQPATPTGRPLFISSSQRISFNLITFNGGRGIFINSSSDISFDSDTVQNGAGIGITSIDSLAHISNSTVSNNARSGISVSGGTFYLDSGVNVTNNGRSGVSAATAHLILNGGDGTPGTANVISHNAGVGVALFNTAEGDINGDNQITFNGGPFGLEVIHTSTVLMSDGIINSNTGLGVHCGESSHCEWSGTTNINSNTGGGVEITDHSDAYLDGGSSSPAIPASDFWLISALCSTAWAAIPSPTIPAMPWY